MPQARLHALHTLLAGLAARPEPGILIIGCTDLEVLYIAHALEQLDEQSPADRFFVHAGPITSIVDHLAELHRAADLTPGPGDPATQFTALCAALLADLPPGDHHLVVALLPTEIHDHAGLARLAADLLQRPLDPRLRLILRDDRERPRHLELAAASPSEHHLAHVFSLPPALFLDALRTTAGDPRARPDDRAQALLQLAGQDLGYGRHADALARCDAARVLTTAPTLQLLALAFKADVLRRSGEVTTALALITALLPGAVDLHAHPIVLHLALALADITRELGRPADALASLALAEQTVPLNPALRAHIRSLRAELSPC